VNEGTVFIKDDSRAAGDWSVLLVPIFDKRKLLSFVYFIICDYKINENNRCTY